MRTARGDVYEGEFKAGEMEGRGTWRRADGAVSVAGAMVGEGVGWSPDGQMAWRLRDGEPQAEVSLDEARALAAKIGVPVPAPSAPAARES